MIVSVIVPTYNEGEGIGKCVESLLEQSYKDFEIIVVDDGSTDKTFEVLSRFRILDFGFRILREAHKGAGSARNFGAKHAKGKILVFVDADMTFDEDFIKNLVAPLIRDEAIGTFSKEEFLVNKDNIWAVCWNLNRGLPKDRMHPASYPDTQRVFRAILKKEFDRVGGFDEKAGYTDDWSLSQKLGVEAVAAPGAVFFHKNPDSLKDVFVQAKWMAKRKYKFGIVGGLIKAMFPIKLSPAFLIFKIVFVVGTVIGILEYLGGKVSK